MSHKVLDNFNNDAKASDIAIYTQDYPLKKKPDPILVGFVGSTDENGHISTIKTLALEERWVKVLPFKGCCAYIRASLCNHEEWAEIAPPKDCCPKLLAKLSDLLVEILCFKRRVKNIADDRVKDKNLIPHSDIVDLFWKFKQQEDNYYSRERDFLRFTRLGWIIMAC